VANREEKIFYNYGNFLQDYANEMEETPDKDWNGKPFIILTKKMYFKKTISNNDCTPVL
jgi:hypothetical protein